MPPKGGKKWEPKRNSLQHTFSELYNPLQEILISFSNLDFFEHVFVCASAVWEAESIDLWIRSLGSPKTPGQISLPRVLLLLLLASIARVMMG